MVTLKVDLQAGFANDRVRVLVDGEVILDMEGVSTDYSAGHAASAETQVEPGAHQVEISLPARRLSTTESVTVEGPLYLGVSVRPTGEFELRTSGEPFRYM